MASRSKRRSTRGRTPLMITPQSRRRRELERQQERGKTRIYLGNCLQRWTELKTRLRLETNEKLANFLLDFHEKHETKDAQDRAPEPVVGPSGDGQSRVASTPLLSKRKVLISLSQEMSEISEIEEVPGSESSISGVGEISAESDDPTKPRSSKKRKIMSSSFVDPFELSIGVEEEAELDDDVDTDFSEYEPSFDVTIGPLDCSNIADISVAEDIFGMEEPDGTDDGEAASGAEEEDHSGDGVTKILSPDDIDILARGRTLLVYIDQLMVLARKRMDMTCPVKGCGNACSIEERVVGSALYLTWVCPNRHKGYEWCSQPIFRRKTNGGDLMISSALVASGNNFAKIELFAKFLNMSFPSRQTFQRVQGNYIIPTVDDGWKRMQDSIVESCEEKEVILLGDGRMDSPGHSAQYCTYTTMENDSKRIISIQTLDKRVTGKKSTNLETEGFRRNLDEVRGAGITVSEVVTDAHLQIGSIMKKNVNYRGIKHSHDVWHVAKNLGKKLMAAGQDKECQELKQWVSSIVNHFWHCCKTATSIMEFKKLWLGILHHVVDEHEWATAYGGLESGKCSHGDLEDERDKPWMKKKSKAHKALTRIIMDKRRLNNIPYWINFRSTSELENFHNHLLMYAAKRFAYTPSVYRIRNYLAAIDYNTHLDRPVLKTKDGRIRYQRHYNKKSGRWSVYAQKEPKGYPHIPDLLRGIIRRRVEDRAGMHRPIIMEASDPRRISANVAPVEPPATAELVEAQKSRFGDS